MDLTLNIHLSTVGAFYPERCLTALHHLYVGPGRSIADTPERAEWKFDQSATTTATLMLAGRPYTMRVIGILRDCCFDNIYPHFTILPLYETDAAAFAGVFDDPLAQDWESEPDGRRPDVLLSVNEQQRRITITDSTDLKFDDGRGRPILPREVLKRNDIVVAFFTVMLSAPLFSKPTYTFRVHHITLVHSSTDREAAIV